MPSSAPFPPPAPRVCTRASVQQYFVTTIRFAISMASAHTAILIDISACIDHCMKDLHFAIGRYQHIHIHISSTCTRPRVHTVLVMPQTPTIMINISTCIDHRTKLLMPQTPTTPIMPNIANKQATLRNEVHWSWQRDHHRWRRRGCVPRRREEHLRMDGLCHSQLHGLHRDMACADSSGCRQSPVLRQW